MRTAVALYVLVGNVWTALALAFVTFASWLLLCDYVVLGYIGQYVPFLRQLWDPTVDRFAFMIPVLVVWLLMTAFYKSGVRSMLREFAPIPQIVHDSPLSVGIWTEALEDLIGQVQDLRLAFPRFSTPFRVWLRKRSLGEKSEYFRRMRIYLGYLHLTLMCGFLRWQNRRLKGLAAEETLQPREFWKSWLQTPSALCRVWIPGVWLIVLLWSLTQVPLEAAWMEGTASRFVTSGKPIYRVFNSVLIQRNDSSKPETIEEELQTDDDGALFRSKTFLLGRGTLTIRVTDFPRVYRNILAECVDDICAIVPVDPRVVDPECVTTTVDASELRAGTACVGFVQQSGNEILLNLKLTLLTRNKKPLGQVWIEPNR